MPIMSVKGPIDGAQLGATLVHEHIIAGTPGEELDPAYAPDRREITAIAVDKLHEIKALGVGAIVDPCPIELGRNPELYAEVSQRSGVKIIFATGFYFEGMGIPQYWRARDKQEIADFFLHELSEGVGRTGLRPGVIKAATGTEVTELERRLLGAAGLAQRQAGCAIITHTEHSRNGDTQQDIFAEHGADLSRVLIGHQDEQTTWEPIAALADHSFVGIDRVGYDMLAPDERRADHVAALLRHGYGHRLCLSQDCVCTLAAARMPFPRFGSNQPTPAAFLASYKPLTYVLTEFSDALRERGVTQAELDTIFRDNPRRLLAGADQA